jgi:hypothetical protein
MRNVKRARGRALHARLAAAAILLVALLAVAGGAAHSVSAAVSTITINSTSKVVGTAALSTTEQPTYVSYTVTMTSQQAWTHVTLFDDGATFGSGAEVVFTDCLGWAPFGNAGFTCNVGTLAGKTSQTFNVVVKTPTTGATLDVRPTVTGKEVGNDQNAGHADLFPAPLSFPLTSDTTNALTSYTNPATPKNTLEKFFTNRNLATGNQQWTEADVPNLAPLGVLVSLGERAFNSGECPAFVAKAGLACFGQVSTIGVDQSGPGGLFACPPPNAFPTSCATSLLFTVRITGLTKLVNLKKVLIFHYPTGGTAYEQEHLCSTGILDSSGDCVGSITQDSATLDIIWTAEGPSNGTWGGAH